LRFQPQKASAIAAAIHWLMNLPPASRQRLGEASLRRVASYGPAAFAAGLEEAVHYAINQPLPRPGRLDQALLRRLIQRAATQA
jgi:predicted DNA-binding transcriptional regulator YafY